MYQTKVVPQKLNPAGSAPVRMDLKPERIQQHLLRLPGWKLRAKAPGIESVRHFTSPEGASTFASYACRLAAKQRQPVKIVVKGGKVIVSLPGYPPRGCTGGLTDAVFKLAGLIGA
ncbi:MAG TPA: hypothetical protein VN493_05035 [Thermoanaerobaculia bacterium]|nr:hypothetical protein [Thermoanaerobaculia bacterium]